MSTEKITQAKAEISKTSAYKVITEFLMRVALLKLTHMQSQVTTMQKLLPVMVL